MSKPKNAAPTYDPASTPEARKVRQKRDHGQPGTNSERKTAKPAAPEPSADLEEVPPPFKCYCMPKKGRYFFFNESTGWSSVGMEEVRRELRAWGINDRNLDGKIVSRQDKALRYILRQCSVDAAMPLAGYKAGLRKVNELRVLVTTSPRIVEPEPGQWPVLQKMLEQFCGVGQDSWGEEQLLVLKLWLARGFRQIHEGTPLPGHCLVLAGPKASCKTMFQERFITAVFGGRKAKAGLVFVKDKDFTSDLAEAEHLYLADELVTSDYRTRMNLAEKIKSFVANRFHSVHPKGVDQMTLDPRWRVSISLNDTPDRLAMLPPLDDEDIADKVLLLRCYPVERPKDDAQSEAWIEKMLSELPAFIHDILRLEVPEKMVEPEGVRFGFTAFRNPSLMAEMAENELESTALAILDKLLFWEAEPKIIEGAPHEIRTMLIEKAGVDQHLHRELQRLCPNESRMGQILARIMVRYPERVQKPARLGKGRKWRILPAVSDQTPQA